MPRLTTHRALAMLRPYSAEELATVIRAAELLLATEQEPPANPDRVELRRGPIGCYALEYVRCGKANCKCTHGAKHGPYWYHYTSTGKGGHRKRYIGKTLPHVGLDIHTQLPPPTTSPQPAAAWWHETATLHAQIENAHGRDWRSRLACACGACTAARRAGFNPTSE